MGDLCACDVGKVTLLCRVSYSRNEGAPHKARTHTCIQETQEARNAQTWPTIMYASNLVLNFVICFLTNNAALDMWNLGAHAAIKAHGKNLLVQNRKHPCSNSRGLTKILGAAREKRHVQETSKAPNSPKVDQMAFLYVRPESRSYANTWSLRVRRDDTRHRGYQP